MYEKNYWVRVGGKSNLICILWHHRQGLPYSLTKAHRCNAHPYFTCEPSNHYLRYFLFFLSLTLLTCPPALLQPSATMTMFTPATPTSTLQTSPVFVCLKGRNCYHYCYIQPYFHYPWCLVFMFTSSNIDIRITFTSHHHLCRAMGWNTHCVHCEHLTLSMAAPLCWDAPWIIWSLDDQWLSYEGKHTVYNQITNTVIHSLVYFCLNLLTYSRLHHFHKYQSQRRCSAFSSWFFRNNFELTLKYCMWTGV